MLRGTKDLRKLQLAKVLYVLAVFGVRISMQGTLDRPPRAQGGLGHPKENDRRGQVHPGKVERERDGPNEGAPILCGQTFMDCGDRTTLEVEGLEESRAQKRADARPKIGLVALKRMGHHNMANRKPLSTPDVFLIRHEALVEKEPTWGVVTDASPKGIGGVIIHKMGRGGT